LNNLIDPLKSPTCLVLQQNPDDVIDWFLPLRARQGWRGSVGGDELHHLLLHQCFHGNQAVIVPFSELWKTRIVNAMTIFTFKNQENYTKTTKKKIEKG
jgi:hypothetical protein